MAKKASATVAAPATEGKVSKADAVRAAMKEGVSKPQEAVAFIKEKFGLDISTGMFSNYKSVLGKKDGSKPLKGVPGNKNTGLSGSVDIESVEKIRDLVGRCGAEGVKQMVNLFA